MSQLSINLQCQLKKTREKFPFVIANRHIKKLIKSHKKSIEFQFYKYQNGKKLILDLKLQ